MIRTVSMQQKLTQSAAQQLSAATDNASRTTGLYHCSSSSWSASCFSPSSSYNNNYDYSRFVLWL